MQKDRLVIFHSAASVDQAQQSALKAATFQHYPSAAHCCKPGDQVIGHKGNYHYINGTTVADAIDTISHLTHKKDVVIVSLSAEMQQAASTRRIPVISDVTQIVSLAAQPRPL